MTVSPLSDVVANQYERWMYPQPILDLPRWMDNNWQWFDPRHAHRMFWPDRDYNPAMDILVAGCGANQAAVFAFANPEAAVVAIDVSQPSLDHHRYLKDRYGLKNLELHRLPIEDVGSLKRDFDLIVSTGVLHHLADPLAGARALGACLRPDGVMALMLYARYGRLGVEMLQSVFRELGLRQNDTSVLMVRDALAALPGDHPVKSYLDLAPDLRFDAGLVDTFLHGREQSYAITDCFDLVNSAGLAFQDIFFKAPYCPPLRSASAFLSSVAALPEEKQWSVMERINFRNACHYFTACRRDRPTETYRIDFASLGAPDYIPSLRYRCGVNGHQVHRHNWSLSLDPVEAAIVRHVDGRRSIKDITSEVAGTAPTAQPGGDDLEARATQLFQMLWRLDIAAMGLKPTAQPSAER